MDNIAPNGDDLLMGSSKVVVATARPSLRSRGRHIAPMGASFNALWTGQSVSLPPWELHLVIHRSDLHSHFEWQGERLHNHLYRRECPTLFFGFFGGVLVTRFNRRRVAMYSDFWRAAAFGLLAYLANIGAFQIWLLALVSFLIGSMASSLNASLIPFGAAVVGSSRLATANARLAESQQIAFVVGLLIRVVILEAMGRLHWPMKSTVGPFSLNLSILVVSPLIHQV